MTPFTQDRQNRNNSFYGQGTLQKKPRWKKAVLLGITGFVLLIGMSAAGWIWYKKSLALRTDLPLILAPEGPYKRRPKDSSNYKVPHKDKTIYDHISNENSSLEEETLRAMPEAPVSQDPSLPEDFVKVFNDDEEVTGQEEKHDASASFFENTHEEGKFSVPDVTMKKTFIIPPFTVGMEESPLKIKANSSEKKQEARVYLVFCLTTCAQDAQNHWEVLKKQSQDLLFFESPLIQKVDHGKSLGLRYHLKIKCSDEKNALAFREKLEEKGIKCWIDF